MDNSTETGKFIVFKIADYLLALPIANVLKVINYPPGNNRDLNTAGLVQIGSHAIALLDLHQLLGERTSDVTWNAPFLLIAQVHQKELCAIPVDEPPNLVELSKDSIRALPHSYHHNALLDFVSYGAILSDSGKTFTIFLLDINRAWHGNKILS